MEINDNDLVEPDLVDPDLRCCICHNVFNDPVSPMGNPCQHVFCNACIRRWLRTNSYCPMDKKPIEQEHLQSMLLVKNIISRLRVKCKRASSGCIWTGTLEDRPRHKVPEECMDRCPHNCGAILPHAQVRRHCEADCPALPVKCPYGKYGCTAKTTRSDLSRHLSEHSEVHLDLLQAWEARSARRTEQQNRPRPFTSNHMRGRRTRERKVDDYKTTVEVANQVAICLHSDAVHKGHILVSSLYNKSLGVARAVLGLPDVEVNLEGQAGFFPIHLAAKFGWGDIVGTLLAKQANANVQCKRFGFRPLDLALTFHHADVAVRLQSKGGTNSLSYAIRHQDLDLLDELLEECEDADGASIEDTLFAPPLRRSSPMAIAQMLSTRSSRGTGVVRHLQRHFTSSDSGQDNPFAHLRSALLPLVDMDALPPQTTTMMLCQRYGATWETLRSCGSLGLPFFYSSIRFAPERISQGLQLWSACNQNDKLRQRSFSSISAAKAFAAEAAVHVFKVPWWESLPWPLPESKCKACPLLQEAAHLLFAAPPEKGNKKVLPRIEHLLIEVMRSGLPWFPSSESPLYWEGPRHRPTALHLVPFGIILKNSDRKHLSWLRRQLGAFIGATASFHGFSPRQSQCCWQPRRLLMASLLRFLSVVQYESQNGSPPLIVCGEPHVLQR